MVMPWLRFSTRVCAEKGPGGEAKRAVCTRRRPRPCPHCRTIGALKMPARAFTDSSMMQGDDTVVQSEIGNRLGRLPFVLLLTVGLLLSLIHCAGDLGPA